MKMMIDNGDDEDDYCASQQGQGCRDKLHAKEVARENFSKLRKLLAWGEAVISTFQVSITEPKHKYSLHFQAKIMTYEINHKPKKTLSCFTRRLRKSPTTFYVKPTQNPKISLKGQKSR